MDRLTGSEYLGELSFNSQKRFLLLLPFLLSTIVMITGVPCGKLVVCYYPSYRANMLKPQDIEADLCTHIVYSFSQVDGSSFTLNQATEEETTIYQKLVNLKKQNPDLKILISVGGEGANLETFAKLVSSDDNMKKFSESTKEFLEKHKLDGVDIDWEFPKPDQKVAYGNMLKHLRKSLGTKFQLTAAVSANYDEIKNIYPHAVMNECLDYVFEMSYNFHGRWESKTGINAPLVGPENDKYTSDYVMKLWDSLGVDKSKLVLGIPLYGPAWTLADSSKNDVGSSGTANTEFVTYKEACQNGLYTWKYSETYKSAYAVKGNTWVSMETTDTVKERAEYVISNNYAGVLFWEIAQDDQEGTCGKGKFPLTRQSTSVLCSTTPMKPKETLDGNKPEEKPDSKKPSPDMSKPLVTGEKDVPPTVNNTTEKPKPAVRGETCQKPGVQPMKGDCTKFLNCGRKGELSYVMDCPKGTLFNENISVCDHAYNVKDCK